MGQWVGSGHINKNQINLELIEIIQFSLKICDLLRHPHLWMGGCMGSCMDQWVNGWVNGRVNGWDQVKPLKSNKSGPNRDNSILFEDF